VRPDILCWLGGVYRIAEEEGRLGEAIVRLALVILVLPSSLQ